MSARKRKAVMFHGLEKLEPVVPITDAQKDVFDAYGEGFNLLLYGVAGTGKTFLPIWFALRDLIAEKFERLIIIRSSVASRDPGFLPGTISEKAKPYQEVYISMVNRLLGNPEAFNKLEQMGAIEFRLTSHLRSLTFDNAFILVDEIQNMNFQELDTIITRVGKNSRIVFCGDLGQNDLHRSKYDVTGLPTFIKILESMESSFDSIEFQIEDIVRGGLVKEYLIKKIEVLDREDPEHQ